MRGSGRFRLIGVLRPRLLPLPLDGGTRLPTAVKNREGYQYQQNANRQVLSLVGYEVKDSLADAGYDRERTSLLTPSPVGPTQGLADVHKLEKEARFSVAGGVRPVGGIQGRLVKSAIRKLDQQRVAPLVAG